jgi:prepilin-type N-terminal cleavage/methylation domain-containing protein
MSALRGFPPSVPASRGFTLVEMVMVMVLLGILAAVGAPMIANGMRVANSVAPNLTTLSQMRYATERVVRELREVSHASGAYGFTSLASSTSLTFTKTNGTSVTIAYASPNLNLTDTGTTRALTTQASAFALAYLDIAGVATVSTTLVRFVDVLLTLQDPTTGATYTQRTRVALRNTG